MILDCFLPLRVPFANNSYAHQFECNEETRFQKYLYSACMFPRLFLFAIRETLFPEP